MESTIKTENGVFTVKCYGKDYKIEMLASEGYDNVKILYVEYSSDFYRLEEEQTIKNLFKELESQIIQIMKFHINENIEFYKHFNIEYVLEGESVSLVSIGSEKEMFEISWDRILKTELKVEALKYLESLTDEEKRLAYDS